MPLDVGLREHTQEAVGETQRVVTALAECTHLLETARGLLDSSSPTTGTSGRWRTDGFESLAMHKDWNFGLSWFQLVS